MLYNYVTYVFIYFGCNDFITFGKRVTRETDICSGICFLFYFFVQHDDATLSKYLRPLSYFIYISLENYTF